MQRRGSVHLDAALMSPGFVDDPYPAYAAIRNADPVFWSEAWGAWLITRYDDLERIARDPAGFSNAGRVAARLEQVHGAPPGELDVLTNHFGHGVIDSDPPAHTRLRSLVMKAFAPRVVEHSRIRIEAIADELVEQMIGSDDPDIVRDVAFPLPAYVISELFGFPVEDRDRFKRWADRITSFYGVPTVERLTAARDAQDAVIEARGWLSDLIVDRRAEPRDDLLTALVMARERDDRLTEEELLAVCVTFMIAGHETTTSLIAVGLLSLLRHPDQMHRYRDDPNVARSGIEELLRYETPVQRNGRVVRTDVTVGGKRLRKGDLVLLLNGAANRDPAAFADPDRLDVGRVADRHLAFGVGIHFCVGAALARLEAPIALSRLLRIPGLAIGDAGPSWTARSQLRTLASLPITVEIRDGRTRGRGAPGPILPGG